MIESQAGILLKKSGLKRTSGRLALMEVLLKAKAPLTQQEISQKLPPDITFNRTSIYRSLEAFLRVNLVHRVEMGDRVWRFAICSCKSRGHCHPHFICNSCGSIKCLQHIKLPPFPKIKEGYIVQEQEYYLRGLCQNCSNGFRKS